MIIKKIKTLGTIPQDDTWQRCTESVFHIEHPIEFTEETFTVHDEKYNIHNSPLNQPYTRHTLPVIPENTLFSELRDFLITEFPLESIIEQSNNSIFSEWPILAHDKTLAEWIIENTYPIVQYSTDHSGYFLDPHTDNKFVVGTMVFNLQDNLSATEFYLPSGQKYYEGSKKKGTGTFFWNTSFTTHSIKHMSKEPRRTVIFSYNLKIGDKNQKVSYHH